MSNHLVDQFRARVEAFLADHPRLRPAWSSAGEFTYLEFLNDDPTGYAVRANVSPEYAIVLADGNVSRVWEPRPGDDETALADELVAFLVSLLGPTVRLRQLRRGRRTARWLLERRVASGWERIAGRFSFNPLSYFGPPSTIVRSNRL